MTTHVIGIDIGGTTIKFSSIDTNGNIGEKWSIKTNKEKMVS